MLENIENSYQSKINFLRRKIKKDRKGKKKSHKAQKKFIRQLEHTLK